MSDRRRHFCDQRYVFFLTFSVYRRRQLLDLDQPKRIVLGTLNHQLEALAGQEEGNPQSENSNPLSPWYLAEDFAFCHRARECGFKIMADTTIRLGHIGSYAYSWEDAGGPTKRFGTYTFHLADERGRRGKRDCGYR